MMRSALTALVAMCALSACGAQPEPPDSVPTIDSAEPPSVEPVGEVAQCLSAEQVGEAAQRDNDAPPLGPLPTGPCEDRCYEICSGSCGLQFFRHSARRAPLFNVVHLATMFKADVFILQGDSWSREEMARARTELLDVPEGKLAVRSASPEDTRFHKLVWYKLGNQYPIDSGGINEVRDTSEVGCCTYVSSGSA